jgi:hypothetical protein
VERHRPELVDLANQVWGFAETALKEKRSSKVLADYAEAQGFKVERGVAGLPTAFVASFGSGKPVIVVLGEYDALPGILPEGAAYQGAEGESGTAVAKSFPAQIGCCARGPDDSRCPERRRLSDDFLHIGAPSFRGSARLFVATLRTSRTRPRTIVRTCTC